VLLPPVAEVILALPDLTEWFIVLVDRNVRFDFRSGT
jgi:hypothetical protein